MLLAPVPGGGSGKGFSANSPPGTGARSIGDCPGPELLRRYVSAWAADNHVVLGQIKVDDKSNEITAIPQLLDLLEISGCIVTIDAMGCQKKIAKKIVKEKEADYVLALKGNQSGLFEDVKALFERVQETGFENCGYHRTSDQ